MSLLVFAENVVLLANLAATVLRFLFELMIVAFIGNASAAQSVGAHRLAQIQEYPIAWAKLSML